MRNRLGKSDEWSDNESSQKEVFDWCLENTKGRELGLPTRLFDSS